MNRCIAPLATLMAPALIVGPAIAETAPAAPRAAFSAGPNYKPLTRKLSAHPTNRDKVDAVQQAEIGGDETVGPRFAVADCVVIEPTMLPYGGSYRGRAGLTDLVRKMNESYSEMRFDDRHVIGQPNGDTIVSVFTFSGKVRSTGKTFSTPVAEHFHFTNGKIDSIRIFYFDTSFISK